MRVLAWVPQEYDTSPGQRFRLEQWEPVLRREGIEIVWSPFSGAALTRIMSQPGHLAGKAAGIAGALARRWREAFAARAFDLVYVFRESELMGPALPARLLGLLRVPFVFDFDDAVWVRYVSPANSYLSYLRMPGKTAFLCRGARHVLAGNPYLRDYALRHNRAVSIVPTTIDTERYRPLPPRQPEVPVIGWTGSYSTGQYLSVVGGALTRLARSHRFRVVVVGGGESFRPPGVEVEFRPWRSATELQDLSDFDIGLMPLPDAQWERGKCGLKALQYMALGVPAVVSPVGVNAQIVRDGENGLVAADEAGWERALGRLLDDASLRARLGAAGRATVEAEYSAAVVAPRVARILRQAAGLDTPAAFPR